MPSLETDWANLPDGPSWAWWLMPILPLSAQLQVKLNSLNKEFSNWYRGLNEFFQGWVPEHDELGETTASYRQNA